MNPDTVRKLKYGLAGRAFFINMAFIGTALSYKLFPSLYKMYFILEPTVFTAAPFGIAGK